MSMAASSRSRSPKTSEIVAREIAAHIVDSGFEEGTPLAPERDMSESLGIGRSTMREALRLLETRGVLTIRAGPGGGPVVRRPRPGDLSEALTLMLQFESATFSEVMDARLWLEPTVARSAATQITDAAIAEMREVNARVAAFDGDLDAFSANNRRFHSIIAESCGNIVLQIFSETVITIGDGRTVGISYAPAQVKAIAQSHEVIIEALAAGDPDAAAAAMQAHLEEAITYWRRRFGQLVSRPVRWMQ
jgi:DNA-binding FadR family transcriptional regulator